jgi:hypothetical protein
MQPIARCDATDANVPAAQNFLPYQRDHDRVIDVVVGRVTGCDGLKSKLGGKADDAWIARLKRCALHRDHGTSL